MAKNIATSTVTRKAVYCRELTNGGSKERLRRMPYNLVIIKWNDGSAESSYLELCMGGRIQSRSSRTIDYDGIVVESMEALLNWSKIGFED